MAWNLDDYSKLKRYLDTNIDICFAMIAKIVKENGQVLHRSTYQAQSQDEWEWEECKAEHSSYGVAA